MFLRELFENYSKAKAIISYAALGWILVFVLVWLVLPTMTVEIAGAIAILAFASTIALYVTFAIYADASKRCR